MAWTPNACFCSKQWVHQNAPYILAPAALRRDARVTAVGDETSVTVGDCFDGQQGKEGWVGREGLLVQTVHS